MKKLILASASKRRFDLLSNTGYDFKQVISNVDEGVVPINNAEPFKYALNLARLKAQATAGEISEEAIIIAADTIVVFKDKILGKPENEAHAFNMLSALSGNIHHVFTGVSILDNTAGKFHDFYEQAAVHMSPMTDDEIWSYIKTGQPMDKAGSYGIQGIGGLFVSRIEGDFFAVEGLPINKVYNALKEFGIFPAFKNSEYI